MEENNQEDFIDLFEYPKVWPNSDDGDLSVWKSWDKNFKSYYYHIGIEGMIGYKDIDDAIDYYKHLRNGFKRYLKDNNVKQTKTSEHTIYHSRDVEVIDDTANKCTWVYVTEPSMGFNELYDTYLWLEDIIKQLESIKY